MTTQIAKTVTTIDWKPKGRTSPTKAGQVVCSFLDTATTNFGRATHYNTREDWCSTSELSLNRHDSSRAAFRSRVFCCDQRGK